MHGQIFHVNLTFTILQQNYFARGEKENKYKEHTMSFIYGKSSSFEASCLGSSKSYPLSLYISMYEILVLNIPPGDYKEDIIII